MRKARWLVLSVLPFVLLGCGGEQHSPANSGWSDELADPTGRPSRHTETLETPSRGDAPAPITGAAATPAIEQRVRHDVMITKDAPRSPTCSCLAVVVTSATDPRLAWQTEAPKLGEDVAVVTVSAQGVPCQGLSEDAPRRPSIAGVERAGADVVITIEDLPPGRPLAPGAVFLKPGPGGAVYVKPKSAKVPYGRPLKGAGGRCRVG